MASGLLGIFISEGFVNGWLDSMIEGAINKNVGHIAIFATDYFENPTIEKHFILDGKLAKELDNMAGLKGRTSRLKINGLVSNAEHSGMLNVVGTQTAAESKVSIIPSVIRQGRWLKDDDERGIVIGARLAEKFYPQYWEKPDDPKNKEPYKRVLGKKLVVRSQQYDSQEVGAELFRVVGIFKSGMEGYDESNAYITLASAQSLINLPGKITEVSIIFNKMDQVEPSALAMRSMIDKEKLAAMTWKEQQPMTTKMIQLVDMFTVIFYVIFYIAMAFGIVNTLLMAVNERYREIGIMLAIGTRRWQIVAMVALESFFLALVSLVAGNIIGISCVKYFEKNGLDMSGFSAGLELFGIEKVIYPSITLEAIVSMSITTFLIAVFFSLYPAVRASRFKPIEAIQKL